MKAKLYGLFLLISLLVVNEPIYSFTLTGSYPEIECTNSKMYHEKNILPHSNPLFYNAEALDFSGNGDHVTIPSFAALPTGGQSRTIEFYFKASEENYHRRIIGWGNSSQNGGACGIGLTSLSHGGVGSMYANRIEFWGHNVGLTPNIPFPQNVWTHFAFTYDDLTNTGKIYIDGVLVGEKTNMILNTLVTDLTIGESQVFWSEYNGQIDEVKIWDHALCSGQINSAIGCELSGTETGLLAYYQFNEGFDGADNTGVNMLPDLSGNGNNGLLQNFTLDGASSNWIAPSAVTTGNSCGAASGCNEAPTAVCKNITVSADANCENTSTIAEDFDGGSSDPNGDQLLFSISPMTPYPLGSTTVTLTVSDGIETDQCTATITVADNEAPTVFCNTTSIYLQANGNYSLATNDVFDDIASSDNCGITSINFNPTTYSCSDIGQIYNVPVSISDAAGNTSACTAIITIDTDGALPNGWGNYGIGAGSQGNGYEYDPCQQSNSGEFTITGAGNNAISTTTDNIAFAATSLCGDGSITAKIESLTPNGYGGVMIRETVDANSKQVSVFSNLTNIIRHETRYFTGANKVVQSFFKPAPYWLKLERQGNWVFAFYSITGNTFQYVHAVYAPMQQCVEIGLASFSYLPNAQTKAVFSNVTVDNGSGQPINGNPPSAFAHQSTTTFPSSIHLFPNPSSSFFTLAFDQPLKRANTFELYNAYGQLVDEQRMEEGSSKMRWQIDGLPVGVYQLCNADKSIIQQIVINR